MPINVIRLRPVRAGWTCDQSGDCCRSVGEVTMTHAERAAIEAAVPPSVSLTWSPHEDSRFTKLLAKPCPLLKDDNRCAVYPVRPFNCRRWGCFRADASTEAFEPEANAIGCANLRERLSQSADVRKEYRRLHRKAEAWGKSMGWKPDQRA